jgi:phenylpropionate dioxygenase-like ring-hydroxylating dioxygenase large terminal subunit
MAKKTEAKRSYKLDIMTVLEAADKGVKEFYTNLTEEEQKAFSPRVLIRWLSTVSDKSAHKEYAILATNDLVNLGMWIPMSKGTSSTPKLDQLITQVWPHTNGQEQQMLKNLRSSLEWQELAKDLGWDDKQIKDLVNELKKISR